EPGHLAREPAPDPCQRRHGSQPLAERVQPLATDEAPEQPGRYKADHDQGEQAEACPPRVLFQTPVAGAGQVTEDCEPRAPDRAAGDVVSEEARVMDAGYARQPWHEHAQRSGKPAEENRAAATTPHVGARRVQVLIQVPADQGNPADRPGEQPFSPTAPDEVPDRVADDRAGYRSDNNRPK